MWHDALREAAGVNTLSEADYSWLLSLVRYRDAVTRAAALIFISGLFASPRVGAQPIYILDCLIFCSVNDFFFCFFFLLAIKTIKFKLLQWYLRHQWKLTLSCTHIMVKIESAVLVNVDSE